MVLTRDRQFYRTFFVLCFTLMAERVVVCSVNLLDNVMLGSDAESAMSAAAAVYLPDETYGITPLKISGSGYATLTHRDYMGSILGLGVEREMIGDIVPLDDRNAVVFASSVTAQFIESELMKIGRDTVKVSPAS